jgi:hypothetical protein
MLLERGVNPWDTAVQLGHQDGGRLICELYGHPTERGARQRLLAAYGVETGDAPEVTPIAEKRKAADG